MSRLTFLIILIGAVTLAVIVPNNIGAAPKPDYLYWHYDPVTLNETEYLLRNWKYNRREGIYYAEYTHEGLGYWFNAPFKFDTEWGDVVDSTNELPEWAVGLPDRYDWSQ